MNKKHLLFITLALTATMQAKASAIDRAQARLVAQRVVNINDNSSDNVPIAPYYVFSRGEGNGYVIVSGDDATAPIIGYTDSGDFVDGQIPAPLQNMLNAWAEKIKKLQEQDANPTNSQMSPSKISRRLAIASYKSKWTDIPVLMSTHWHQSYPYNMLAPHRTDNNNQALTGCLATAASQIVYYFRKDNPTATLYDTPTYGYGGAPVTVSLPKGTPLRYDLMKTSGNGTLKQDSAVAVLMYAAGTSAWLTYGDGDGTATSGQNSNMGDAIRGQFALNNECKYKSSYSQQSWETLVYNNLASGRPLLYTGASESQGGHAVVLDGYQASTGLYHFNFGWGGQGDGYYTIDDETGMNGFSSSQSALVNITPKNQNYKASILPPTLYEKTLSTINVKVTNDATLAQSKFYIYCSTTTSKPSDPTDKDEATIVASGDSAILSFTYRPIYSNRSVNIWLYDANNNLLDKTTAEVSPTKSDLSLKKISVDASDETTELGGIKFQHLYSNEANVSVELHNGTDGTVCQPTMRCSLFEYDTTANTWASDSTNKYINTLAFNIDETRDTIFSFRNLKVGSYYKVRFVPEVTTGSKDEVKIDVENPEIYFRVFESTLAINAEGRNAVVSGGWNPTTFEKLATDAKVTSYDLSQVSGINSQPKAANANALFYTTANAGKLTNVVVDNVCENLVITEGYDFIPRSSFHATQALFAINSKERAEWNATALPFAISAPEGVQIRKITGLSSLKCSTIHSEQIAAAAPFEYLSSNPYFKGFEANDVDVLSDSVYASNSDSIMVRTTNYTTTTSNMLLGVKNSLPYFLKADEGTAVASFAMVVNANVSNGIRLLSDGTIDRAYTALADSLYSAHIALAANPTNSECKQFADSITAYTNAFSNYAYSAFTEVNNAAKSLGEVTKKFLANELPSAINATMTEEPSADAPIRYYSIDGTPLQAPRRGIVIMRQGNKVRKMIVR